jgi:hypothetical protein
MAAVCRALRKTGDRKERFLNKEVAKISERGFPVCLNPRISQKTQTVSSYVRPKSIVSVISVLRPIRILFLREDSLTTNGRKLTRRNGLIRVH